MQQEFRQPSVNFLGHLFNARGERRRSPGKRNGARLFTPCPFPNTAFAYHAWNKQLSVGRFRKAGTGLNLCCPVGPICLNVRDYQRPTRILTDVLKFSAGHPSNPPEGRNGVLE